MRPLSTDVTSYSSSQLNFPYSINILFVSLRCSAERILQLKASRCCADAGAWPGINMNRRRFDRRLSSKQTSINQLDYTIHSMPGALQFAVQNGRPLLPADAQL
jgi:hypothetical protein